MPTVPCHLLHPKEASCAIYNTSLWLRAYQKIIPVHLSLNAVPILVFKTKSLFTKPFKTLKQIIFGSLQSALFFASYITIFQSTVCLVRATRGDATDHRYVYYLLGLCSGTSIFLEQKRKRVELAMYVAPKALASFYTLMINRYV